MKKLVAVSIVLAILVALAVGVGSATASIPSAKATANVGSINWLDLEEHAEAVILQAKIKTPNEKDLFIGVSLESGLYTDTLVKSKLGVTDTSVAKAEIDVRVLVDDVEAYPGSVVFNMREQTLTAKFEGMIAACLSIDDLGNIVLDEDCVTPEELELILDTMSANSFNFILDNVPQGVHTVKVLAKIDTTGSAQLGSFTANATIGKGSVTVEEVRLIKDDPITELP